MKEVYKENKSQDSKLRGREINKLVQEIHKYRKLVPNLTEEQKQQIEELAMKLKNLCKEKGFKNDFPSLPKFKKFLKKNKISLEELKVSNEF